jgi:hypothetical protein
MSPRAVPHAVVKRKYFLPRCQESNLGRPTRS